jgi:hypothetical protein
MLKLKIKVWKRQEKAGKGWERLPPARLGKEMVYWLGKARLG